MSQSIFEQNNLGVVIVGGGTIARALADQMLQRNNTARLLMLSRSPEAWSEDSRVVEKSFSIDEPETLVTAAQAMAHQPVHCLINTVGVLHNTTLQPEKRLADVTVEGLRQSFSVNAMLLPFLAQAFGPHMKHSEHAVFASLSARVGSIGDNHMGGWYSYRASKAAHNMLLRTVAREWRVSHKNACVVALHPGTVKSRLSEPFVTERYGNRVLSGEECAEALVDVLGTVQPGDTGRFLDWEGKEVAW